MKKVKQICVIKIKAKQSNCHNNNTAKHKRKTQTVTRNLKTGRKMLAL
jgi:hypothetical protein